MSKLNLNKILPADTAKLYEVVDIHRPSPVMTFGSSYGNIDFRELTPERAERLIKSGFKKLKKKPAPKKSEKDNQKTGE